MLGFTSKCWWKCSMFCVLIVVSCAPIAAVRLSLESPTGISNLVVPPGGNGVWTFRVRNVGDSAGAVDFTLQERRYNESSFDQYVWTSLSSGCGAASSQLVYSQMLLKLPISSLNVGEARTCSYRIDRTASSRDDLGFRLCSFEVDWVNCYRHQLNIGNLPDTALRVERVGPAAPGSSATLFRLRATNPSAHAISSRIATTACREFSGGIFDTTPYLIDTDFPGSCPTALGEICLNFTGQNFDAVGFELGPIPAQGTNSCLIKLVPRPDPPPSWFNLGPYVTPMYFRDDQVSLADGGLAFDPDIASDQTTMGAPESHSVPISAGAMGLLAILMMMLAGWSQWRLRTAVDSSVSHSSKRAR